MVRTPSPDDDPALRWDDLDDPTYAESDVAYDASTGAADDEDTERPGDGEALEGGGEAEPERAQMSLAARLVVGLFGAIYLVYSVGWILSVGLVPLSGPTVLIEIMYQFSEFLAIIASALWFGAVMAVTRDGRSAHRLGWLALGTLVLIPWPILLGMLS